MNENDFQENAFSNEVSVSENIQITDSQKVFLKEHYSDYRYKQNTPKKTVFTQHPSAILWTVFTISIFIFSICIISDAIKGTSDIADNGIVYEENADKNTNPDVNLSVSGKPSENNSSYTDESGKYTTEGIAVAVRPSVVEIYTYSDTNYNTIYGTGSGVIMSDDGYVITNAHVLEGAKSYTAVTYDGTKYKVSIVGKDTKTDLAVIKITTEDTLTPAEFGNSDEVVLGEQVMAIGNPGGLTGSITGGYVSGLNRKIKTDSTGFEMNCIQTDAAISPGNSGGALVNMYGQVIGITSSKYVNSSYEGLGFAITINDAKPIIDELISNGYVSGRYKIGINFYSPQYAPVIFESETGFTYPENIQGVLIGGIEEDCDIANTEIQAWDFITEVEGQKVTNYDSLMAALENKNADDTVKAHVVRIINADGDTKEFDILFRLMPDTSGNY